MKIDNLPIPIALRDAYYRKGITELYPPQEECIKAGLFEKKNILAAIPTASGKTIIAEMAMQKTIEEGGKCLYIVPLKALASEKYEDFSGKGVTVGIATGDPDQRDEYLSRYDIVVATSEKADSLLRNKAEWIKHISLLVIDEIHLIGDEYRGATLEMVIAEMRFLNPSLQIIGLSATMGNPEELAKWLDAALITSEWRPVDLREGVYYKGKIHFHDKERIVPTPRKDDDLNLLLDTVSEGGQCLVFVSSRRSAEAYAKRAAIILKKESPALEEYARKIEAADTTNSGKVLAESVRKGAAFHHAGLPRGARAAVEEGFRKGDITVISSTPTLAAGLNLPARRVIVRDYMRYDSKLGMGNIPVMEYRQMAGRAGRPHLDPYGEAVLIAKTEDKIDELFEEYIDAPAENIKSQCQRESELRSHILALITSEFTKTKSEVDEFMEHSFYASQKSVHGRLIRNIDYAMQFLRDAGMIDWIGDSVSNTRFGTLASQLYLCPESALAIKDSLIENKDKEFSNFGILHMLCMTPDMNRFYLKASDQLFVDKIINNRRDEFWQEDYSEEFYGAIKTAIVIEEWMDEIPENTISERYGIGSGDIHNTIENIKWLLHATKRISREFTQDMEEKLSILEMRVTNGIKEELIPLISLKGIGRVRARRLFGMGITNAEEILAAKKSKLIEILGDKITENVLKEASRKTTKKEIDWEEELPEKYESNEQTNQVDEKKNQPTLFDF